MPSSTPSNSAPSTCLACSGCLATSKAVPWWLGELQEDGLRRRRCGVGLLRGERYAHARVESDSPVDLLTGNQLVVPKPLVREAFSDLCSSDVAWEAENPLPARAVSFSACLGPFPASSRVGPFSTRKLGPRGRTLGGSGNLGLERESSLQGVPGACRPTGCGVGCFPRPCTGPGGL